MADYNLSLPGDDSPSNDGFSLVQPSGTFDSNSGGNGGFDVNSLGNIAQGFGTGLGALFAGISTFMHPASTQPNQQQYANGTNGNPQQNQQQSVSTTTIVLGVVLLIIIIAAIALIIATKKAKA